MPRNDWIRLIPRPELNLIHHSLRMYAQHLYNRDDYKDREQAELLADLLWNESVSRGRKEGSTSS